MSTIKEYGEMPIACTDCCHRNVCVACQAVKHNSTYNIIECEDFEEGILDERRSLCTR